MYTVNGVHSTSEIRNVTNERLRRQLNMKKKKKNGEKTVSTVIKNVGIERKKKKTSESERIERMKDEKEKGENPFFLSLFLTGCFFFLFLWAFFSNASYIYGNLNAVVVFLFVIFSV